MIEFQDALDLLLLVLVLIWGRLQGHGALVKSVMASRRPLQLLADLVYWRGVDEVSSLYDVGQGKTRVELSLSFDGLLL